MPSTNEITKLLENDRLNIEILPNLEKVFFVFLRKKKKKLQIFLNFCPKNSL